MKFTTAEALFHKAGGKRTGLPSWCYNNAELTQLEMEQVFPKLGMDWPCFGHPESRHHLWIYWGMFPGIVITPFPDMIEVYQVYLTAYQNSVMAAACYGLPDA